VLAQFASEMLIMLGAGVLGLGARWRRIGAPLWLTLNRSQLLDLLVALRTGATDLANDAWTGWGDLMEALTSALDRVLTAAVPAQPLVLTDETADRDFPGSDTPTVRIQITQPLGRRPKTIEIQTSSSGHYRHLAGRPGLVLLDDIRLRSIGELASRTRRVVKALENQNITDQVIHTVFHDKLEKLSRTREALDA
jgi:hypothetical protein